MTDAVYSGLIIDSSDSGLFVDSVDGLGIDSVLNLSVDPNSYPISPSIPYVTKYLNLQSASYTSNIDETLFAVSPELDILDMGGNSYLQTDQYATYDAVIHRTKTIEPVVYTIGETHVGTYINQAVYVVPEIYSISGVDVGVQKFNRLVTSTGSYVLNSFAIFTSVLNKLQQGKFTKDSANLFNLYLDQGSDYFIIVNSDSLGISTFDGMTFTGKFAKHSSSSNKYNITCNLISNTELKLSIPKEISSQVYGKYLFDVIATKNNLTTKILQGNIFINELVAP